jgi:hypothetical protein
MRATVSVSAAAKASGRHNRQIMTGSTRMVSHSAQRLKDFWAGFVNIAGTERHQHITRLQYFKQTGDNILVVGDYLRLAVFVLFQ